MLERLGGARYYVDVGANHGWSISNTFLLDKLGWRGLCVEPHETAGYEDRTCIIDRSIVGGVEDQEVEFVFGDESAYGGKEKFLGIHAADAHRGTKETRNSTTLEKILEKHHAPKFIDFLSLDTEGSEYEILSALDLDKWIFGHLAVVHNMEEPKRGQIRKLLLAHGYVQDQEVNFDDWYVREGCTAASSSKSSLL